MHSSRQSKEDLIRLNTKRIWHLVNAQDVTSRLLQLMQTVQQIPETAFRGHSIGSENAHTKDLRVRVRDCGCLAADNLKLANLKTRLLQKHTRNRLTVMLENCLRCGYGGLTGRRECVSPDAVHRQTGINDFESGALICISLHFCFNLADTMVLSEEGRADTSKYRTFSQAKSFKTK